MNMRVENVELSGKAHLAREGSEIPFFGGNVDFCPYIDELLSGRIKGGLVSVAHAGKGFPSMFHICCEHERGVVVSRPVVDKRKLDKCGLKSD